MNKSKKRATSPEWGPSKEEIMLLDAGLSDLKQLTEASRGAEFNQLKPHHLFAHYFAAVHCNYQTYLSHQLAQKGSNTIELHDPSYLATYLTRRSVQAQVESSVLGGPKYPTKQDQLLELRRIVKSAKALLDDLKEEEEKEPGVGVDVVIRRFNLTMLHNAALLVAKRLDGGDPTHQQLLKDTQLDATLMDAIPDLEILRPPAPNPPDPPTH